MENQVPKKQTSSQLPKQKKSIVNKLFKSVYYLKLNVVKTCNFFTEDFKDLTYEEDQEEVEKKENFKYNQIYNLFKVPFRLEKFFFWVILLQFSAIVYNLLIVPMRALVTIASILFCRKGFTPKRQFELARVTIMAVCTLILMHNTNSSVIYHWIRGQSLFKLYMIKGVIEISDLLFKGFGHAIIENFARGFYQGTKKDRLVDTVAMIVYVTIHSYILTLEMFTLHVVITSSEESVFSFLFYNNFTELKITVFKKVDIPGLYQYACNDSIERLQLNIYLMNILSSTSQDKRILLKYAVIIMLSEMVIDCIKHFFITRINKLRTDLYIDFKTLIFRNYLTKSCNIAPELQNEMFVEIEDEQGVKTVQKFFNYALMEKVFDCETLIVMSSNFLMFPQIVLILRNIIDYLYKTRMGFSELAFKYGLLGASGLLLRYIINIVTLGESVRRVVKAYK